MKPAFRLGDESGERAGLARYRLSANCQPTLDPRGIRTPNPLLRDRQILRRAKTLENWSGRRIRTPDPLLPKQMRYQAALRPDVLIIP